MDKKEDKNGNRSKQINDMFPPGYCLISSNQRSNEAGRLFENRFDWKEATPSSLYTFLTISNYHHHV